ncbi:BQ5605_C022g09546 [Microbotryum silenes-dioicae]|uniref:BQ5605_C022g09546 protein n=1 Tax=Microbotryum silenes-dioicae TaxID=796604 RepID=A0A2X0PLD7_9BASI|nr:BQ5605_C022g09546 [Microbotryum silenes-dioicae]
MTWNSNLPSTYHDLLHCVYPFHSLRSLHRPIPADGTESTNKPTFGTQREPGGDILDHPLTSICHDSSIIDRATAALKGGLITAGEIGSALPDITGIYLKTNFQTQPRIYNERAADRCLDVMLRATPTDLLREYHGQPARLSIRFTSSPNERLLDPYPHASNLSDQDIDTCEDINTVAVQTRMADELKACYFGEDGVGYADPLDLRLVTVTGEPRELQGGCAIAAMVGKLRVKSTTALVKDPRALTIVPANHPQLALHIHFTKHARFGIIYAPPYFVLAELVIVDGRSHLLVGDLHSIVLDPEEPRATVKPFLAILLALFMDHCDGYHIEGPPQHILDQVAIFSRSLDRNSLAHDRADPRPRRAVVTGDAIAEGTRSEQPSDLPASSQSFCRFGESIVTANHFPGRAIICDANALPNSRMLASPIELEAEMAPSSDTPASSSPSALPSARKKICLDSDASHRSKLATTLPRAIQLVFNRSSMARAEYCPGPLLDLDSTPSLRLDLVRRVGHGATSVVWEAEWVTRVAASWQPEISCAEEGPSPSPRTGTPLATTPATTPISTPVTTPASMWDPSNTPYTSPASSTNSAVDGSSPSTAGVGQGKLIAKVVPSDFVGSVAKEYFVYTSIVPLLSPKARGYFPAFYGLYRSGSDGHAYVLVMEDTGSEITEEQLKSDIELKAQIDAALTLIADEGLVHGDQGARNVLLRPDGRICLIDWDEAQLR